MAMRAALGTTKKIPESEGPLPSIHKGEKTERGEGTLRGEESQRDIRFGTSTDTYGGDQHGISISGDWVSEWNANRKGFSMKEGPEPGPSSRGVWARTEKREMFLRSRRRIRSIGGILSELQDEEVYAENGFQEQCSRE